MKPGRFVGLLAVGLLALSRLVARAAGPEPLWAYGFLTAPKPEDQPVSPVPTRTTRSLRANEPAEEQTRLRRGAGSSAAYSRVDLRDGGNVADWFPDDHPPMSPLMKHGPASLGKIREAAPTATCLPATAARRTPPSRACPSRILSANTRISKTTHARPPIRENQTRS